MGPLMLLLAAAEAPPANPTRDQQYAILDKALAQKDYDAISATVREPRTEQMLWANLDWLSQRWREGETALLPILYATSLWQVAEGLPVERRSEVRGTAAAALIYSYAVTFVDGSRCGDRSAPAHRRDQAMGLIRDFWQEVRAYPLERRKMIAWIALAVEKQTADARDAKGDVDFMCRFGMEEMTYNLKHGTMEERPPMPGQFGRQIAVTGDGKFKPSTVPEANWRPAMAKAREDLPSVVLGLLMTSEEIASLQNDAK